MRDESNLVTNVVKDIIKQMGKSLVTGKFTNLLKIRTPAYTHQAKSYLDCIKFEFCLLESYLL